MISTKMTFESALTLLFGNACPKPGQPPDRSDWKGWRKPKLDIDIDDSIGDLIRRLKNPSAKIKIRERSVLEAESGGAFFCPYYEARLQIAHAAEMASRAASDEEKARDVIAPRLASLATEAHELRSQILHFARKWKVGELVNTLTFDGASVDVDEENHAIKRSVEMLMRMRAESRSLAALLLEIEDGAKAEKTRVSPKHRRGDVWRQMFIEHMGHFWFFLTGSSPSTGPAFHGFAYNAFRSLGGDSDIERPLKTVLARVKRRPRKDGFERDETSGDEIVFYDGGIRRVEKAWTEERRKETFVQVAYAALRGHPTNMKTLCEILAVRPDYRPLIAELVPQLAQLPYWTDVPAE